MMSGCNRQAKIDGSSNSCSCSQNDISSVTGESVIKDVATVLKDVASVLKDVASVVKDVASLVKDVSSDVKYLKLKLSSCDDDCDSKKMKQSEDKSQTDDDNGRLNHDVFDESSFSGESGVKDVAYDVKNLDLKLSLCNNDDDSEKIKQFEDKSQKDDDKGILNHHVFDKSLVPGESAVKDVVFDVKYLNLKLCLCDNDDDSEKVKLFGDKSQKDDDNGRLNHHVFGKSSVIGESAIEDVSPDMKNLNLQFCLWDDDGDSKKIKLFEDKSQKDDDNGRLNHVFDKSWVTGESASKDVAFDEKNFNLKLHLSDDDDDSEKIKQYEGKSQTDDDNGRLNHHVFDKSLVTGESYVKDVASDVEKLDLKLYLYNADSDIEKVKQFGDHSQKDDDNERLNHVFDKSSVTEESAVNDVASDVKNLNLKLYLCDDDGEAEKIKQFGDKSQKDDDYGRLNHHVSDKSSVTREYCVKDVASDVKNLKLEPCLGDDDAEKIKQFGDESQKDDDNGRLNHHVSDKSSVTEESCVKDVASDVKNLKLEPCLCDDDGEAEKIKQSGDESQKDDDKGRLNHHVFDKSSVIRECVNKDVAFDVKKFNLKPISFDDDDNSKKMKQFGDKSQKDDDNRILNYPIFDYSSFIHVASNVNNLKIPGYNRQGNRCASGKSGIRIKRTVQKFKAKIDGSLDSSRAKRLNHHVLDESSVTGESLVKDVASDVKDLKLKPCLCDDDCEAEKIKQFGDKSQKDDDNRSLNYHVFDKSSVTGESCVKDVASDVKNLNLKLYLCDDKGEAEKIKQFGNESQKDGDNGRLHYLVFDKSSVTGESCVKDVASDVKDPKLKPCLCDDDGEAEKIKQFGEKPQKDDDNGRLKHHVFDKSSVTGESFVKDAASDVKNPNLKSCLRDDDGEFEKIEQFGDKSQKDGDNGRLSHHVSNKYSVMRESVIKDVASDVKNLVKDVAFDVKSFKFKPISFDDVDNSKKMKQLGDKSHKDDDNRRLIHHNFDYSSMASHVNNSKMSGYNRPGNRPSSVEFDSRIKHTDWKPKAKIDGSLDCSCAKSDKSSVTGESVFIHPASDPRNLRLEPISFGDKSQKDNDNERISHHVFDICPKKVCSAIKLKTPLHVKNKERRNQMKQATSGDNMKILRSGMVLMKGYISSNDQISIVKTCRELGIGDGGFYQPGYRGGRKLHLKMMCLGKNWDPDTHAYTALRSFDNSKPPGIPEKFHDLVKKAIQDSNEFIRGNAGSSDERRVIPSISPDICIVKFYSKSGTLGLHQDKDESEMSLRKGLPVVSFSIGDSAEFVYGETRSVDEADRVTLESGDVLIYGGKSRLIYHGVTSIIPNTAPTSLMEATDMLPGRLNLTFRMF